MIYELDNLYPEYPGYSKDLSTITEISNSIYQSSSISPTNYLQSTKETEIKIENYPKIQPSLKKQKTSASNHQEKPKTEKLLKSEKLLKISLIKKKHLKINSNSPASKQPSINIRRFSNRLLRDQEIISKNKELSKTILALMKDCSNPAGVSCKLSNFKSQPLLRTEKKRPGYYKLSPGKNWGEEDDQVIENELRCLTKILMNNQAIRVSSSFK